MRKESGQKLSFYEQYLYSFMHTDRVRDKQSSNAEFPIWIDPKLMVTEIYYAATSDYVYAVGGTLAFVMNIFFWLYTFVAVMLALTYIR